MNRKTQLSSFAFALICAVACFAQDRGPGGPGGQGQGGPPPDFNPQAMRQRMMDRMKERLGATEDEWKVLSPRIEKVMSAQRDLRVAGGGPGGPGGGLGGSFGGLPPRGDGGQDRGPQQARGGETPRGQGGLGGGPGGPPPQDQQSQSPLAKARQDLREAVDDASTSADELAKLVKTYREAREGAKDNLVKSQKDLKELATPKQEAFFVSMGLLD